MKGEHSVYYSSPLMPDLKVRTIINKSQLFKIKFLQYTVVEKNGYSRPEIQKIEISTQEYLTKV